MLKIWKQAWKKEDSKRYQNGLDDGSKGDTYVDPDALVLPNTALPAPAFDNSQKRNKRTITSVGPTALHEVECSPKKVKLGHSYDNAPRNLSGRRGQIPDGLSVPLPHPSIFDRTILRQASSQNTIALISPDQVVPLLSQYLSCAFQTEGSQHTNALHVILVVTENEVAVDQLLLELRPQTDLRAEKHLESSVTDEPDRQINLLRKRVVVTTAPFLYRALQKHEISLGQLHSLIILNTGDSRDDPLSSPINDVMKEFYHSRKQCSRPRIIALLVHRSHPKNYSDSDILKIECAFDGKLFCTPDRVEYFTIPDLPSELVVLYDRPMRSTDTKLFKQLHQLDPAESIFRSYFHEARYALLELGSCASDLVWRRALKDIESRLPSSYEDDEEVDNQMGEKSGKGRSSIQSTIKNWVYAMPNLDSSSKGYNVTPKFSRLVQILNSCRPYGETFRGIVFVQRRITALAITDLLRHLVDQLNHIRPCALMGLGWNLDGIQHEEILRGFATGTYNLLIATKSVEDLDIPGAVVVIRFDLFESQLSCAYARLRATEERRGHLVHMAERGNDVHRRILSQFTSSDERTRDWNEEFCRSRASSIPPQNLRETTNSYNSDDDDDDDGTEFIKDPTTSGRIYLKDATYVIFRFAAHLDTWRDEKHLPLFVYEEKQSDSGKPQVSCLINLPASPIHAISATHRSSKSLAKRAACYRACLELYRKGFLDYRLYSLSSNSSRDSDWASGHPDDRNHLLTLAEPGSKAMISYSYQTKKPHFWKNMLTAPQTSLYPVVIMIARNTNTSQPYAPMVVLTRRPLPELHNFNLFFSGVSSDVRFKPCADIQLTDVQLHDLYLYTIRVCRSIANKPFVCSYESMVYFFAPLSLSWREVKQDRWSRQTILDDILWDMVSLAVQTWVTELPVDDVQELTTALEDAVIQDRVVEFTRRYDAIKLRSDLTPLSAPVDSPREAGFVNFVEYCRARCKGFEGLRNYNQPLVEVARVPAILNHLNPTTRPVDCLLKVPAKYLIPELCAKFTIPASTFRTALLLPSIMRRIDDLLLVKELNARLFNHVISDHLLQIAVSAPSSCNEYDYERLELLGDSFLKYLSTIYVFVTNPSQNEGAMHIARQRIISNKALLHSAVRTGLPAFIQAKPFSIRTWQPPNFSVAPTPFHTSSDSADVNPISFEEGLQHRADANEDWMHDVATQAPGRTKDEQGSKSFRRRKDDHDRHWLGNKAVADVTEAIVGAAYLSGGHDTALTVTKALNIPIPNIDDWSDFGRKALAPPPDASANLTIGSTEAVESIIGHKFRRPHLLAQALTHSSRQGYEAISYERLEFIGDGILDFMVIRYLFERHKQLSPGCLTLLKGAMVSNSTLAAVCVWSGLHRYLLYDSDQLRNNIEAYASQFRARQVEEYKEAERDNRLPGQYWRDLEPPKTLSDVVESIAGALYISDNFSPVGAEALFENVLKPFYDRHISLKTLSHHPTKILFELFQAQGCQQFQVTKEKDQALIHCQIIVHEVVLASATDTTAPFASRLASTFALDALEGDPEFLTRTCNCRAHAHTRRGPNKKFDPTEFEADVYPA